MGKGNNGNSSTSIEKRGGYPSSSKPVKELAPPPKGPGAGAKPSVTAKK
jgi:hypothetical protein